MKKIIIPIIVVLLIAIILIIVLIPPKNNNEEDKKEETTTTEVAQDLPEIVENKQEKTYMTYDIKGDFYYRNTYQGFTDITNLIILIDEKIGCSKQAFSYGREENMNGSSGMVFYAYDINGIKTNKTFILYIEDNKIYKVVIGGIKKSNLNRIQKIDEQKLIDIKNSFDIDAYLKENNIDRNNPPDDYISDGFNYDYNTNTLTYDYLRKLGSKSLSKKLN